MNFSLPPVYVRPLTSKRADGTSYERMPETEAELRNTLGLPQSDWIALAPGLRAESLIHLIREVHGQNDKLFGELAAKLSKRPKGLRKGQPLYWQYLTSEAAIFGVMGMFLAEAVWPWLS